MAYRQSRRGYFPSAVTIFATVIAALIAGTALGVELYGTGTLQTVTAVYGMEDPRIVWTLVFSLSIVAAVPFVALVRRLSRARYVPLPLAECHRSPFLCACVGVSYGVLLWVSVVVYGVPYLLEVVAGGPYPVPYHHWESFVALLLFGAVFGAWYPLLYEFFDELR